jgi:peptide/nickel transport system permease protein
MLAYIIRRLLLLPVLVFGVTVMIFAFMQLLDPIQRVSLFVTDPAQLRVGPEGIQRLIEKYGLNDPIPVQYWRWLVGHYDPEKGRWEGGLLRGDWGWSHTAQRPVLDALLYYLPATAELALWSLVPVLFVGIWLGIISAIHHNRPLDHLTRVFAIVGWSFPTFVFGLLMLMFFYGKLQWFPPGRLSTWAQFVVFSNEFTRYTGMNTLDALLNGRLDIFWDALRHLAMPAVTLAYVQWALLLRVTRSSMLETLRQDYVQTARAKGLPERKVIYKHAQRNALIPVVTIGGLIVIYLLNGVVITETVFTYKGLGWWVADAALRLDIPSVLGFTLFNGVLFVVGNLVVDVLYAMIDPRVRLE